MSTPTSNPVNVGLIGCGDISREHIKTYQSLGLNIVALCDLDRARSEKRKAEFGLERAVVLTDPAQLFKRDDIELVTVATPVAYHAPLTIAALQAGNMSRAKSPARSTLAKTSRSSRPPTRPAAT